MADTTLTPEPLTYSAEEAARLIPMGINQFRAAVKRGEIPAVTIGNRIRVPKKRFHAFIEGEDQK